MLLFVYPCKWVFFYVKIIAMSLKTCWNLNLGLIDTFVEHSHFILAVLPSKWHGNNFSWLFFFHLVLHNRPSSNIKWKVKKKITMTTFTYCCLIWFSSYIRLFRPYMLPMWANMMNLFTNVYNFFYFFINQYFFLINNEFFKRILLYDNLGRGRHIFF